MRNLIIIIVLLSTSFGEDLLYEIDNRFATKINSQYLYNIDNISNSGKLENGVFSPVTPMLASLAIPGLGQYLNQSPWWKTALFAGVEVIGITGYFVYSNRANDITDKFENWADDHWDMQRWVSDSAILLHDITSNGYPSIEDVVIDGSHHITIIVNGQYESSEILLDNPNIDYEELRDWDFYEGIGKYDQFVARWDDAKSDWEVIRKEIKNGTDELIVMTPNKKHYLNLRNDSNILYRNAKFAASTILLNHLLSALDALLFANKNRELSYKLDVSLESQSNYEIKGIAVEWNL